MSKQKSSHLSSVPDAPVVPSDLIAAIRSAGSIAAAITTLSPSKGGRTALDLTLVVNTEQADALPVGGTYFKVYTAAVLHEGSFKAADIEADLTASGINLKQVPRIVRRLAKTGHFVVAS